VADSSPAVARVRALGYRLLPLPPRQKFPPPRGWTETSEEYAIAPGENIAIATGPARGGPVVVISNDERASAVFQDRFGPPTVWSQRGAHWWFRGPAGTEGIAAGTFTCGEAEMHSDGRYVLVPPSVHPSGTAYRWDHGEPPKLEGLPPLPLDVRSVFGIAAAPVATSSKSVLKDKRIPHGQHHKTIVSMSASIASRTEGIDEAGLIAAVEGALAPLLDDLEDHRKEIAVAAHSALSKFGRPAPAESAPALTAPPALKVTHASPWSGRTGWSDEGPLPILTRTKKLDSGKEVDEVKEPGYEIYNQLVGPRHYRPFRTISGEPRVAIPTRHGLEICDPTSKDGAPSSKFIASIGYSDYTLKGEPVPTRDISRAVGALTGRALSRDLPPERIVELWVRFAPGPGTGGRIDMADSLRRCIVVDAERWHIQDIGHPTFDPKPHMRALPVPTPSNDPAEGWKRVEAWWRFVPLSESDGLSNPRLLALADQVQRIIAAGTACTVKIISGEEGIGKTKIASLYQALLDPSSTKAVAPPADDDGLINLAMNHATVNLDNVSYIAPELSDNLCRLSTGIGLTKRKLFSDSDEISVNVVRSVILNGITSIPRAADLLRRCIFLTIDPPRLVSETELDQAWSAAHPEILGGLLDLAVLTARTLRDNPPPPCSTNMADYVRIGQAMAAAMGLDPAEFVIAWEKNVEAQGFAAAEDPWVSVLSDYFERFTRLTNPVRSEEIATWVNRERPSIFPKPVSPQSSGQAVARSKKTLRRLGIHIRSKVVNGHTVYYRFYPELPEPETAPPAPPAPPEAVSSRDELQGSTTPSVVATNSRGGPAENEPHPGPEPHPNSGGPQNEPHPSPTLSPTLDSSSIDVLSGGAGGPLSSNLGELAKGGTPEVHPPVAVRDAERLLRSWEAERDRRAVGRPTPDVFWSVIGPFVEYPDGHVTDRSTGDVLWRDGDDPALKPSNPPMGKSTKPHTKRSF
jgi:Bifunctional DNA primase/polymerase, N-terminal